MPIFRDLAKVISKLIDKNAYTTLYPKLMNRNYRSTSFLKNDYQVPEDNSYIFIHLPKTGGMTFQNIIKRINMEKKEKIYVGAHNPVSIFCSTEEKGYITIFRDPIERVYSFYKMNLADKKQIYHYLAKKSLSYFIKFCPEVQNAYCQYYSGYIDKDVSEPIYEIALKNLKEFKRIFDFNNLSQDIKNFCEDIDFKINQIPHINSFNRDNKNINSNDRKIIEFYNYFDLKLYNEFKNFSSTTNNSHIKPLKDIDSKNI